MVDYTAEDLAALATAIYGEARTEPRVGQDAVAHVAINRARLAGDDVSVADVVYGSTERIYGQFSFANPPDQPGLASSYAVTVGDPPKNDPDGWAKAVAVAEDALEGRTRDPTGGSSHYYNPDVRTPSWAKTMPKTAKIGHHQFHKDTDAAARAITRASAFSPHRRQPGNDPTTPGVFGHHVMSALDGYRGPAIPFPTERGVSKQDHLTRLQMYEPGSGDMGVVERQEPAWSDQFAPGPKAAPPTASQIPPGRTDYPTGSTNPEPRHDAFEPAPQYARRTASPARFNKTFATSDPQAPPLVPGTSNAGKAAAYRGLAKTMQQAGLGGLDGKAAMQSRARIDQRVSVHPERGLSTPAAESAAPGFVPDIDSVPYPTARPPVSPTPDFTSPVPSSRPPARVPFTPAVPTTRPHPRAPVPAVRPPVHTHSTPVPIPTRRPVTSSAVPTTSPHRNQLHQQPSPYSGPKKQIFDFVLRQLVSRK